MAETMRLRVPKRDTGAEQLVVALKVGNAAGAKGLHQMVKVAVQLQEAGGDRE